MIASCGTCLPHRFAVTPKAVYGLGLIIGVLGCNSPGRVVGPTLGEVSLRIPGGRIFQLSAGSDGSLFASGTGGVYRRRNGRTQWELLIPTSENITRMYSPSADDLFALAGDCAQLYQWSSDAAWRRIKLPTSDSTLGSGTPGRCIDLFDIWGRKSADVYVVGERGTIIHYDGANWALESNPLIPERNPQWCDPLKTGQIMPRVCGVAGPGTPAGPHRRARAAREYDGTCESSV